MNTKIIKISIVMTAILLLVNACGIIPSRGSGNLITETREVSGFDAVVFSGAGDVEIIQDGTESITIETDDDVMQYVEIEVRSGTLYVGLKFPGIPSIFPTKMHVTLHVDAVTGITASGAWSVHADLIETDDLHTLISGTGEITIDALKATSLEAEISGAGKMEIAGEVSSQRSSISGTGKYLAGDLQSETAVIQISGAGEATLWATESLDVTVSGTGQVEYYGSPQVSFTESGSGDITSLGDK